MILTDKEQFLKWYFEKSNYKSYVQFLLNYAKKSDYEKSIIINEYLNTKQNEK